jgi:VIT1/CCC1 family predicted Fe2+/Mn2+ transporter
MTTDYDADDDAASWERAWSTMRHWNDGRPPSTPVSALASLIDADADDDQRRNDTASPARQQDERVAVYLRSAVNGAINGTATTFMMICASFGVRLSVGDIATMSSANLLGDGLALGIAEAISSWIATRHGAAQFAAVVARLRNDKQATIAELIDHPMYVGDRGMLELNADADRQHRFYMYAALDDRALSVLVGAYSVTACPLRDVLADGTHRGTNRASPLSLGITTTVSFVLCGAVAILAMYAGNIVGDALGVLQTHASEGSDAMTSTLGFYVSGCVTVALLFSLGAFNARYIHLNWWRSGALIVASGTPTALIVLALSSLIEAVSVGVE